MSIIGDARLVLLSEASHGTHEFYRERARITERLIFLFLPHPGDREPPLFKISGGGLIGVNGKEMRLSDLTALKMIGAGQEHAVSKYKLNSGVEVIRSLPYA